MKRYQIFVILLLFPAIQLLAQPERRATLVKGHPAVGFEDEINQFLKHDAESFPPRGAVLFTGSSTIRKWDGLKNDFKDIKVIQRGFGGSNMKALNYYIPYIVLPYKPSKIVVYEGDNDIAAGVTPVAFVNECDSFIRVVSSALPGVKIYFISIKPSLARENLIPVMKKANTLLQQEIKKYSNVFFWDTSVLMYDSSGRLRKDIFLADGLHMNRKGYELWAAFIRKQLGIAK